MQGTLGVSFITAPKRLIQQTLVASTTRSVGRCWPEASTMAAALPRGIFIAFPLPR
jgi:hypothetical protein